MRRADWTVVVIATGWLTTGLMLGATAADPPPASALLPANRNTTFRSVAELAAEARKSVVVIEFQGRDGDRQGLGSGVIIDAAGLVATNLHVIGEARPILVRLHDGRQLEVKAIYATERDQDLAILQIDAAGLPALPLGNSDSLVDGQQVVAIGNPLGLERSVVSGVLSGRRDVDGREMLQLAIPIERGNSGGPLLDMDGRVHGLLTLKSQQTDNLGFAVPSKAILPLLKQPNPVPMDRWLTIGVLDPEDWTVLPGGRWRQRAGRIVGEGRGAGIGARAMCLSTEPTPELPYEVAVTVRYEPAEGAAGLVFLSDGGDRHYGFYPSNGELRLSRFDGPDVYAWTVLQQVRSPHLKKTGWNTLKVRLEQGRIACYVNDHLVIESADAAFTRGRAGLCKFRQTEAEFKGFRIAAEIPLSHPTGEVAGRVQTAMTEWLDGDRQQGMKVVQRLAGEPATSLILLQDEAERLEQRAEKLRRLATDVHHQQTLNEISRIVEAEPGKLDLLRAALLIARLDNPELDVDDYVQSVDRMAARIGRDWSDATPAPERLAGLNRYLFAEQGYHGSRMDYHNRSNSYLNEVIDDREGMPITLAVLYMELARRLNLPVVGVGLPGHFVVRHEPASDPQQLIDVFERGKLLSRDEAIQRVREYSGAPWEDRYLEAMPPKAILIRMLRNLFNTAREEENSERMYRYTDAVLAISPDSEQDRFFRAVLAYQTQRLAQSRQDVNWLLQHPLENVSAAAIEDLARALSRAEGTSE